MNIRYNLNGIDFEWDELKGASNLSKHKVSFEMACEIFFDPFLVNKDVKFADDERREIIVGATETFRLLYVAYTIRDETVRLISARAATKQERNSYENQ